MRPRRARGKAQGRCDGGKRTGADEFHHQADGRAELRQGGDAERPRTFGKERKRSRNHGQVVDKKPKACALILDQILNTWHCGPPENGAIAFEPGQKRNNLVELREAEAGQPAKDEEVDESRGAFACRGPCGWQGKHDYGGEKSSKGRIARTYVELHDFATALAKQAQDVGGIEKGGEDGQQRRDAPRLFHAVAIHCNRDDAGNDDRQGRGARPQDGSVGWPRVIRRKHEHRQQPVADADRAKGQPACEAKRRVQRHSLEEKRDRRVIRDRAGKDEREGAADKDRGDQRAEPHGDETRGKRQRTHRKERRREHDDSEPKAHRQ